MLTTKLLFIITRSEKLRLKSSIQITQTIFSIKLLNKKALIIQIARILRIIINILIKIILKLKLLKLVIKTKTEMQVAEVKQVKEAGGNAGSSRELLRTSRTRGNQYSRSSASKKQKIEK